MEDRPPPRGRASAYLVTSNTYTSTLHSYSELLFPRAYNCHTQTSDTLMKEPQELLSFLSSISLVGHTRKQLMIRAIS